MRANNAKIGHGDVTIVNFNTFIKRDSIMMRFANRNRFYA